MAVFYSQRFRFIGSFFFVFSFFILFPSSGFLEEPLNTEQPEIKTVIKTAVEMINSTLGSLVKKLVFIFICFINA